MNFINEFEKNSSNFDVELPVHVVLSSMGFLAVPDRATNMTFLPNGN